ncbi:TonB-dependent siderophore receptor [Marinomonas dokdonensis]|uniref:TonB-dependent siderophore receptor n=1 Tax=Marinomonas dokdonensis TaxID=328224 RepID=UPI0040555A92
MNVKFSLILAPACGAVLFAGSALANDNTSVSVTQDDSNVQLEAIQVEGRALSYYKEDETTVATGTATPIDETPQSVQVLTETLIEDQAARQISDLYRSISGVSYNNFSVVTMRGFEQDVILYDGLKGDPFSGFSIPQLFNISEIQVLKGPAGAIYGAGDAGGVINYVTKKPSYEQQNRLEVTAGNEDFLSGSIESSGPANEDASQRYRVGIYSSGEDSYRNNVEEENRIIDLGYAWDLDAKNTLSLQYTDIKQYITGARIRGIPTDDDGNFLTDISWNNNEKSDFQELDAQVFQATLDHNINSWLDSRFSARYFENKEVQNYHEIAELLDNDGDGNYDETVRQYRDRQEETKGLTLASSLVAELDDHTILAGVDLYHEVNDMLYYRAEGETNGVSNLSFTDPVYGQTNVSSYDLALRSDDRTILNRGGVYLQDQWRATDKLSLVAGGRADYMSEDFTDNTDSSNNLSYNDIGYSTRLGTTYELSKQLKPYASYSTGFTPQSAEDQQYSADGSLFDPEKSQQVEVGVRSYLFDNRLNLNFALYRIIRNNMLTDDPDEDEEDYLISIGEIRSKGFEVDALVDITPRWVANVNYAYNDLKVSETSDDGRNLANSPYHQLGVWTRYDFPSISSSIALGADYVSQQKNRDDQIVKPFTVYDLSWQTNWEDWKFQVNVKNLFDKEYAVSGFTETIGSYVGEPRRVYLSAAYDF